MIDILLHHFREVWIFFALGMGGFLVARPIRARKRTKALTTVAQEIGFTVRGDDWLKVGNRDQQPEANPMGTALFLDGTDRRFNNIMTGTAVGCKASLFDYSYSPLKGRIAQTVAAYSQERCLPFFQLRPAYGSQQRDHIDTLTLIDQNALPPSAARRDELLTTRRVTNESTLV